MASIDIDPVVLANAKGKTVVVTGGANGIGAELVREFYKHGAQVMIADLPSSATSAQTVINALGASDTVAFFAANTTDWASMSDLYAETRSRFGRIDIVVANAGIMESQSFFDFKVKDGRLLESHDVARVIDVNLKGTANTLRLAMFHMSSNPVDHLGFRGSIVLVASTSGYFGGTGVISYIASKHGTIGILRSSQKMAKQMGIRVNAVAPSPTPTFITEGYSARWRDRRLPENTPNGVAECICYVSLDSSLTGACPLIIANKMTEVEGPGAASVATTMGSEVQEFMAAAGAFFDEIEGYPLPRPRV